MTSLFYSLVTFPRPRNFQGSGQRTIPFPSFALSSVMFTGSLLPFSLLPQVTPIAQAQTPLNPDIKVGIVQRFGEKPTDTLEIKALPGNQLTLSFKTNDQVQTLSANQIKFDIQMKPLAEPVVDRKVVISTHRSFESAEAKAEELRSQGIQVELAQPNKWQVWGKRDVYPTPDNQAWLLNQVQQRGFPNAFIQAKTITQKPQLSWTSNGYRYHRNEVTIESGNRQFLVGSDRFAGKLNFQPNAYGNYTLVNHTPIETYLRGVVPYEIGPRAPDTAVQAQSIIARTYALRNLRRFKIDNYELCATTQCQVFKGLDASSPRVDRAISATTGRVLTYNNELIDALYSSTTGGVTAQFQDVWEGQPRPYLQARIDSASNQVWNLSQKPLSDENNFRAFIGLNQGFNEETWRHFRWERESSLTELNKDLKAFLKAEQHPLANFTQIQNLQVTQRALGGRVQQLTVSTDLGQLVLTKDEILRAFEAPNSLLFYLEPQVVSAQSPSTPLPPAEPSTPPVQEAVEVKLTGFKFIGGGLGHAVGLSQTGSYRLSDLGYSADQILQFYYPGTQIVPLTSSVVYWTAPPTSAVALAPAPVAAPAPESDPNLSDSNLSETRPDTAPASDEQPASVFGIPLPNIDFSVLWEWVPFL